MNSDASLDRQPEDSDPPAIWHLLGQWRTIAAVSVVLLLLTLNPILAGFLPYVRAGWPAARTAFWLKATDPWKARGTVGWLFHLCMALFLAGASGLVWIVVTGIVAGFTREQPDLTSFIIAIMTITCGCLLSTLLSWCGILIAFRHGVRIYVSAKLRNICEGDFAMAETLAPGPVRTNPANYILAVATATPMLAAWFAAMIMTMPGPVADKNDVTPLIVLGLLPVLAILCIAIVIFLSRKIMAQSPAECWGCEVPESETAEASWSRRDDDWR